MNKEESEKLSGRIAYDIASNAPVVEYSLADVERAKKAASPAELAELKRLGLLKGDFELYYVLNSFLSTRGHLVGADDGYLKALFDRARKFRAADFLGDAYIKRVRVPEVQLGDFTLTMASYEKGEFFQYDMPDLSADPVVLNLGFFTDKVEFPTIYEGNIPWMSACPSEINSMKPQMKAAFGNVLVLGLGLGYYPFVVAQKKEVEHVTIIEIQPEIIELFEKYIFPHFPNKDKITLIKADAFGYLEKLKDGEFDFCFADIWENQFDGSKCYQKIKPFEQRLPHTTFTYWIEDQIKWYLGLE